MSRRFRNEKKVSLSRAKELLRYDPNTGLFTRLVSRPGLRVGAIAGCKNTQGYIVIMIDYVSVSAHRLAWLFVHGRWPAGEVDHRDLVKDHNWIDNIREATQSLNNANRRTYRNNKSGFKGVMQHQGRWRAMIRVGGRSQHIGSYDTPEEAHSAYAAKAKEAFGEFANAG